MVARQSMILKIVEQVYTAGDNGFAGRSLRKIVTVCVALLCSGRQSVACLKFMRLSYFATCRLVIPGWEFITRAVPPGPLIITIFPSHSFKLFLSLSRNFFLSFPGNHSSVETDSHWFSAVQSSMFSSHNCISTYIFHSIALYVLIRKCGSAVIEITFRRLTTLGNI